jgi:hypothetical protein
MPLSYEQRAALLSAATQLGIDPDELGNLIDNDPSRDNMAPENPATSPNGLMDMFAQTLGIRKPGDTTGTKGLVSSLLGGSSKKGLFGLGGHNVGILKKFGLM